MAKKSKIRPSAIASNIASPAARPIKVASSVAPLKALSERLRLVEDRRQFSFAGPQRSARSFSKSHHQLVIKKAAPRARGGSSLSAKVAFHAPKKVLVCVRRQRRKEVLFATKRFAKGSHARRRSRGWFSSVSC